MPRKAWRLVATPSPVPRFPHLLCEDSKTLHLKEGVCANCKYSVIVVSLCSCLFLCLLQSLLFVLFFKNFSFVLKTSL